MSHAYTFTGTSNSMVLTRNDGKIVIDWGTFTAENDFQKKIMKVNVFSQNMSYDETLKEMSKYGQTMTFLKSENPEEAAKMQAAFEIEYAAKKQAYEAPRAANQSKKQIVSRMVEAGTWRDTGMAIVDVATGMRIKDVMSFA